MSLLKRLIPLSLQRQIARSPRFWQVLKIYYSLFGRPRSSAETSKAHDRRCREDFFRKFCSGSGLDVGYGGDLVADNCQGWDFEDGDAHYLNGLADSSFDYVYTSHTLEHMARPEVALQNWMRVVRSGGYLILYVPHRDLYEKRKELPSRWNLDHKFFILPDRDESPDTLGLVPLVHRALGDVEVIYTQVCSEQHTITDPDRHSDGEYSIEMVIRKSIP